MITNSSTVSPPSADRSLFAEPWRADAACRTEDPRVFFPGPGDGEAVAAARAACAACQVLADCLDYALRNRERFGIWGGTTGAERAAVFAAAGRPLAGVA